MCVLPHEFSLIHLHGFLTALPRPDSQLPRLASASLMLPRLRSRETASPTSLRYIPANDLYMV